MASRQAACFPPPDYIRRLTATTFLLPIWLAAFLVAMGLALPAGASGTDGDGNFSLGERACQQVLAGGNRNILGSTDYSAAVNKAGLDQATFCTCVAMAFDLEKVEQSARMDQATNDTARAVIFAGILTENMNTCLDPQNLLYAGDFYGEALEAEDCSDGCQDGPVWEEEANQLQCEYAIDGTLTPPAIEPEEILEWIEKSGISAQDLCTCSSRMMEEMAEEFEAELAGFGDHGEYLYWFYMNQAISQCSDAMWNGKEP